jgi:hypothetical protein
MIVCSLAAMAPGFGGTATWSTTIVRHRRDLRSTTEVDLDPLVLDRERGGEIVGLKLDRSKTIPSRISAAVMPARSPA